MQRKRVDVAHVLIFDDAHEHVLLVQDNGYWSLPGGAREIGEMLEQTAVREAKEETGFDVTVEGIIQVTERFIRDDHTLFVTFRGTITGGQIGSDDPEIGTIVWKTIAETERLVPYYRDLRGMYDRMAHYQVFSPSITVDEIATVTAQILDSPRVFYKDGDAEKPVLLVVAMVSGRARAPTYGEIRRLYAV